MSIKSCVPINKENLGEKKKLKRQCLCVQAERINVVRHCFLCRTLNVKRMMEIILDTILQQGAVNMVMNFWSKKSSQFLHYYINLLLCDTMSFERYMVKVTHNLLI